MTKIKNLEELFIDQLQDRYSAAQQQKSAFEKLHDATEHSDLKKILKDDIEANDNHLKNLEQLLESVNANPEGEYCEGTAGLVKEAIDTLHLLEHGKVLDIAIAISVQHINHHDIAGYNGCVILANRLGNSEMENKLNQMLDDEKRTDKILSDFIRQIAK